MNRRASPPERLDVGRDIHETVKQQRPVLYLGVLEEDRNALEAMDLPISLCSVSTHDGKPVGSDAYGSVRDDMLLVSLVGFLALDKKNVNQFKVIEATWMEAFGESAPETMTLSETSSAERIKLLDWLIDRLTGICTIQAERNVRLQRDLIELRRNHEDMQISFRNLEYFLHNVVKPERWRDFSLAPIASQADCELTDGTIATQRLPRGSVGLSDLVLYVAEPAPRGEGWLKATLKCLEERRPLATWTVDGAELEAGALRLSLPTALGQDKLSLLLDLEWDGQEPLRLKTTMAHPDPRFQLLSNSQSNPVVLAMEGFRFVPGVATPVPAGALTPSATNTALRTIPAEHLAQAINLKTGQADMEFFEEEKSLQVHVEKGELAAALLKSVCGIGLNSISCTVETRHEEAPDIEYALAIMPRNIRNVTVTDFNFGAGYFSGWHRIKPQIRGEVRIDIPTGLDENGDLYMLTRLPRGIRQTYFGWSTFSNIIMRYNDE